MFDHGIKQRGRNCEAQSNREAKSKTPRCNKMTEDKLLESIAPDVKC